MKPDEQVQTRHVRCPHCGWSRQVSVRVLVDARRTDVVRGWGEALGAGLDAIRRAIRDTELDEANSRFDVECANCRRTYRFNVLTGAAEP